MDLSIEHNKYGSPYQKEKPKPDAWLQMQDYKDSTLSLCKIGTQIGLSHSQVMKNNN